MNQLRLEAEKLRARGYSYGMINEELGIAKSTMNYWFKDMPFKPNKRVVDRIKYGPMKSGAKKHNLRVENIKKMNDLGINEVGSLSKRDLWMLGIGLYIGEGSKTIESVRIANSDPSTIALAIKWLKEICELNSDNIVISLHLYPDSDVSAAVDHWRKVTGLPYSSFRKTHIDLREDKKVSKRGKLPYGTAYLRVNSNGDSSKGVILHRRINGWISGSLKQI